MPLTLPYFKFNPTDWLTSEKIAIMELHHTGAYINLLSQAWTTEQCSLPNEETVLKKMCKWDDDTHSNFHLVMACFEVDKKTKRLYNARLYREWIEAHERKDERRQSGLKGAEKRWAAKSVVREKRTTATTPPVDWLATLKANPAYTHLNIDTELAKMDAWLSTKPGRKKTKSFVVNWLNKIEPPLANGKAQPPPYPPKNDPIGRGQWKLVYGKPEDHGYVQ